MIAWKGLFLFVFVNQLPISNQHAISPSNLKSRNSFDTDLQRNELLANVMKPASITQFSGFPGFQVWVLFSYSLSAFTFGLRSCVFIFWLEWPVWSRVSMYVKWFSLTFVKPGIANTKVHLPFSLLHASKYTNRLLFSFNLILHGLLIKYTFFLPLEPNTLNFCFVWWSLTMQVWLVWNCVDQARPPPIHGDPPASALGVLR